MSDNCKIFFTSDFHLGLKAVTDPLERERRVVKWLHSIAPEAKEIYLLGDIFDFWWEYKKVVPRGFTRFLGFISELTDSGIPVHFFTGNHDMWIKDYLSTECGMTTHEKPMVATFNNKRFYLAHGDGLGTGDAGYKFLLKIFHNKPLRLLYSSLHPAIGVGIGHAWSLNSRLSKGVSVEYKGDDKEDLLRFASSYSKEEQIDYFIFGHRHIAMTRDLSNGSKVIILGDWIKNSSYAVWDGSNIALKSVE